jgi:apolipoprotein D and lipocalin family protein
MPFTPFLAAFLFALTGLVALATHAQTTSTVSLDTQANINTPAPTAALPVVAPVDLQRYAGTWYEQARLPNRFQRSCTGQVTARYDVQPDGNVRVTNSCAQADGSTETAQGIARVVPVAGQPGAGRLEVSFAPRWLSWVPVVWGDYWIMQLDADYQIALVGTPNRKYLWVLTRAPQIDAARLQTLLDYARGTGFDTAGVVRTPSAPAVALR